MKKVIITTGLIAVFLSGCTGVATQMIVQSLAGSANQKAASSIVASSVQQKGNLKGKSNKVCMPRMATGQVNMTSLLTKQMFNLLVTQALKNIEGMKDVQLPKKIMDTCEADARLKYIESISNRYFQSLNIVNKKILEALEETKEINQLKADMKDRKNIQNQAQLNVGIAENTAKIQEIMKNTKVKDAKKISEAQGIFLKSFPKYTALLIGWDKEIAEFGKDNILWAIKNFTSLKILLTQLKTVVVVGTTAKSSISKVITNSNIKIDTRAANRAAKNMMQDEKKLIAKSEQTFKNAF